MNTTPDTNIDYLSPEGLAVLKKLNPDQDAVSLEMFARACNRTQLDPITRQIYSIARKAFGQTKWMTQISIDGFRVIGQRSGEYRGQIGPHWCGKDGVWKDVWISNEAPIAARVGILRAGFDQPLYAVARYDAYVGKKSGGEITDIWKTLDDLMIGKVAEALAWRRAFPQELSGLYATEEMDQVDNGKPAKREEPSDPNLEKQLAASIASNMEKFPPPAPAAAPPAEAARPKPTLVAPPVKPAPTTEPTQAQDVDIAMMRDSINHCETPEAMSALLPVVMKIKDPVVKTAAQHYFKTHREAKGWKTARNAKGEPGVVA